MYKTLTCESGRPYPAGRPIVGLARFAVVTSLACPTEAVSSFQRDCDVRLRGDSIPSSRYMRYDRRMENPVSEKGCGCSCMCATRWQNENPRSQLSNSQSDRPTEEIFRWLISVALNTESFLFSGSTRACAASSWLGEGRKELCLRPPSRLQIGWPTSKTQIWHLTEIICTLAKGRYELMPTCQSRRVFVSVSPL